MTLLPHEIFALITILGLILAFIIINEITSHAELELKLKRESLERERARMKELSDKINECLRTD